MKRRHFLLGGAGIAAGAALMLRPADAGGNYSPYFAALNKTLKAEGPGRPVMLIDKDRLLANAQKIRRQLPTGKTLRLVAKSLPSYGLLQTLMNTLGTQALMVFHQPHLNAIASRFPATDLLLGKPMPVQAVATFYRELGDSSFNPAHQLQWLIDSEARLREYQQLARQLGVVMRVNLEIDVGLHRGGLDDTSALKPMLDIITAPDSHLEFSGFMGYDAHVGKIPGVLESRTESFAKACSRYREFQNSLWAYAPALREKSLTFNGAGSPTLRLHDRHSPLNEVAAGSCFVKPTDFDLDLLADLQAACFIATPVLKALSGTRIPGINGLRDALTLWDQNLARSYFIYGGLWQARYEAPPGLQDNALYGKSSNQAIVTSSARVPLQVNDQIFLRPTQSERVFLEFGDLLVVSQGQLIDRWPVLPT